MHSKSEIRDARRELEIIGFSTTDKNVKTLVKEQFDNAKKYENLMLKKLGKKIADDFKREPFFATFKWSMITIISSYAALLGLYSLSKIYEMMKNNW
ncbi:hypothetical protein ES703_76517 [subsurface metagenome]